MDKGGVIYTFYNGCGNAIFKLSRDNALSVKNYIKRKECADNGKQTKRI